MSIRIWPDVPMAVFEPDQISDTLPLVDCLHEVKILLENEAEVPQVEDEIKVSIHFTDDGTEDDIPFWTTPGSKEQEDNEKDPVIYITAEDFIDSRMDYTAGVISFFCPTEGTVLNVEIGYLDDAEDSSKNIITLNVQKSIWNSFIELLFEYGLISDSCKIELMMDSK